MKWPTPGGGTRSRRKEDFRLNCVSATIISQISRLERRYLSRDEITAIAEQVKDNEPCCREVAALYHWLNGPHEPANGRCLEVCLTRQEAWWVDNAGTWLGID